MAADYPTALPTFAANGANLSTAPHSALHTDLNEEVAAIAGELGLSPSDTFSTVKARLDSIAAKLLAIDPVPGALTSHTPSLTQPGAITKTVGSTATRYMRVGRLCTGWFNLAVTGAGTVANPVLIGAPLTAATSDFAVGSFELFDTSTGQKYVGTVFMESTTTFSLRSVAAADNRFGVAPAIALASGDTINGTFSYMTFSDP